MKKAFKRRKIEQSDRRRNVEQLNKKGQMGYKMGMKFRVRIMGKNN